MRGLHPPSPTAGSGSPSRPQMLLHSADSEEQARDMMRPESYDGDIMLRTADKKWNVVDC